MPTITQDKRWRSLQRRKGRSEHGLFLAEGFRLLEDLLASGLEVRCVLHTPEAADSPPGRELVARCEAAGVELEELPAGELERYADTVSPQGVVAIAAIPDAGWGAFGPGDVVVLDAVQDPGNAGTILRTAEALGAAGLVSLPGTVDLWNPKVVRAAAGALFRLPVLHGGWPEVRSRLRERGGPVWASDADGEPLRRGDAVPPAVSLVLGNEGAGVREEVLADADRRVAIPLPGGAESLNVALASAILMDRIFSARRGRA